MYDDILAEAIVQKALNGDAGAQTLLGHALDLHGEYQEAVKWLRSAADQGYDAAQTTLGSEYFWGHGVEKDYKKAVYWWRKAADQGQGEAQALLGAAYYKGYGVSPDEKEAVVWLEKAAQQGIDRAISLLATIKQHGGTEQKNRAEPPEGTAGAPTRNAGSERSSGWLKWIIAAVLLAVVIAAADHSYQNAQTGIERLGPERSASPAGAGHEQGLRELEQGEKSYYAKNYPEAVKWFRKSAGQGNARAQNWLGEMYYYGLGVSRNDAEAAEWYRKSAEHGNPDAETFLGTLYEDGMGVRRDYEEALKWFRRAAAHGSRDAQAGIERLEKLIRAQRGVNASSKSQGSAAAGDDPGAVSMFGRKVYLRGEFNDCPWDKLYDRCLIRKVGYRVYMATAYMKAEWAPYKFKFGDANWITNFGYAPESKPGIYDYARGTPVKMNPKAVFEEIKVTPPHDGKYDFYLDFSGDVPVTYVREHR